jgi:hypothetical protein
MERALVGVGVCTATTACAVHSPDASSPAVGASAAKEASCEVSAAFQDALEAFVRQDGQTRLPPGAPAACALCDAGLATAIRHDPSATPDSLNEAARLLDPEDGRSNRLERIYNLALLTWGSSDDAKIEAKLKAGYTAQRLLSEFIKRTQGSLQYQDAVKSAEEVVDEARSMVCLLVEGSSP